MKFLIVDDDINNRMTLELLLEEFEGIEISEAMDGQEAIDLCKSTHFDIIFMDIMMPNVDGITATKVIKSFDKKTMILALSALDDETSKNEMLASGAEDYMTKPIEDQLFHQRVKNYIQIVQSRHQKPTYTDAINPFSREVYSRSLKFTINSLSSLAEFWDYYLNQASYEIEGLEECIRIIYAFGQYSLKTGVSFTITAEENDANLFLVFAPLETISGIVVQQILLKNYKSAIFILEQDRLSFRLPKGQVLSPIEIEKMDLTDHTQTILSKTHFNKTPASEYVDNTAIDLIEKIDNLESIKNELESAAIDFEREPTKEHLVPITEFLATYITVIENLMEFEHFAYALKTLNAFLGELEPETLEANECKKFSLLFLSLLDDLEGWRSKIFILKEANDIHYLDSSLLSSCLQIQALLTKKEVSQQDEDDFELF
ncbi:MAG: response regulator [Sulfuricurvum sp.]|nr:response regulator [Sulfuricurvum sp.]